MNTPDESEELKNRVAHLEMRVADLEARLREEPAIPPEPAPRHAPATPPPLPREAPAGIFPPRPSARPAPAAAAAYSTGETVPVNPAASNHPSPSISPVFAKPLREEIAAAEPGSDWRAALRKLSLWPPEDGESTEARAGAWWATRIGAALLVIGVVFFGVYLAQGVSPLIRFLQLAAVAAGLTAAGHWLEKRIPRFGQVVFGSGLALVFFTSFAAHAVPAVRVLPGTVSAIFAQLLVLLLIGGAAWWKNRPGLAAMTLLFGYVSCFFSFAAQMHNISLVAAFLLAAAAAGFLLLKGWLAPAVCAVPGSALIYATILHFAWPDAPPPSVAAAWLFPAALLVLFLGTDLLGARLGRVIPPQPRRWLLLANAAFATGLGLWATVRHFPDAVAGFYFLFAAIHLGAVLTARRGRQADELTPVWFAAAMGLLALGFIELLDTRTRWIALAVQSLVILQTARRTRQFTAEAVMALLWVGAGLLFIHDTTETGLFQEPGGINTLWGAAAGVYLVLAAALVALQARWLAHHPTRPAYAAPEQSPEEIEQDRLQLNFGYAIALGGIAAAAAHAAFPAAWVPTGSFAALALLAAVAAVVRHPVAAWAAAVPFLYGQFRFWIAPHPVEPSWAVWINGALAILTAAGAAAVLHREAARGKLPGELQNAAPWAGHAIWLISVQALLFKVCSLEMNLLISALLGLGLWAASRRLPALLAELVPAPVLLAWAGIGLSRHENLPHLASAESGPLLFSAALTLLAAVVLRDSRFGKETATPLSPMNASAFVGTATVVFTGLFALIREFDNPVLQGALGLAGAGFLILKKHPGWPAANGAAVVFLFAGHAAFLTSLLEGARQGIGWTLLLAALTLIPAVLAGRRRPGAEDSGAQSLSWCLSAAATATLFLLFYTRGGGFAPYVTVLWGAAAGAVFLAGLAGGAKPPRMIGLAGLALCLPRVFLVDIHSTLHRIAAFLAIGLVLLIIGFLYHRFRNRIGDSPTEEEPRPD